ncbi:MAG: epoxyqueuosine reductase QueH [Deltaproteobacteria bacterium]|nr:epoxyqueuosine reductase QueH [Deltaproteobacteria bacterium]
MKVLIHICCANCLIYPLKVLREEGWEVMGFFYNPNIHPYQEYMRRLEAVRDYEKQAEIKVIYRDEYTLEEFLRGIVFREENRCRFCYHLRLEATAQVAKRGKFDAFTSTLLHSKHQNHQLIQEIGNAVGKRQGVKFLYRDFRKGWQEGIEESKALGLYRQQYCGCIYSEKERYLGKR